MEFWKGRVPSRGSSVAPSSNLGSAIAGCRIPDRLPGPQLLAAIERGSPPGNPRKLAFGTCNGQQFGLYCQRLVRDRKYKFIWNATDIDELYDLESDPFEMKNWRWILPAKHSVASIAGASGRSFQN